MLIFDAHIDTLSRLASSGKDLSAEAGHVHLNLLREGKIGAQFFAAFIKPKYYHGMALHNALELIDEFWTMINQHEDSLAFAGTGTDILRIQAEEKVACLLAIEGGEALEGKLGNLRMLHRLGVRLITLTWNHRNQIASGQSEGQEGGGLSNFGRKVVQEMNRLGMIVDVSHLNDPSFWDVLESSVDPIIASHSNARALCNHPRNLNDDQIRALADRGGVIGVNFYPYFLDPTGAAFIGHVIDQIDYLVKVGGIQSVALGSDFDGIDQVPLGLENCSKTPQLISLLQQKGFQSCAIEKIMGGNLLRLCRDILG